MTELSGGLLAAAGGALLGLFYYAGLWFTLRLAISIAGFYFILGPDRRLPRLGVALLTFIAARMLLIRRLRPAPATSRHTP